MLHQHVALLKTIVATCSNVEDIANNNGILIDYNNTLLWIFANTLSIIRDKIVDIITLLRTYGNFIGLLEITKLMDTMCNTFN
jgi:hypothetical protein